MYPTRQHTPLTDEHLAMLRGMLEEQWRFRVDQLTAPCEPQRPMTAADLEVHQKLMHGAHLALHEVDEALQRMREGTYGRCVRCDAPLPLERLEILPQATLCMSCQQPR